MPRKIPQKIARPFQFLFCMMAFLGLVAANHNNQSINLYGGGSYVLGDEVSLGYNLPPNYKAVLRLYSIENPEALLENGGPRNFSASDELDLDLVRDKKISASSEYQYDDVIFDNLPVGMYFAQLQSGTDASATLIAISDVSLVVKSDQDSILAYTANLTTGTPLKTKVFLMQDEKIYAEGLATDDGLTNFTIEENSNNNQTFIAAKFGSSWAFSESYWSSWGIEKTKIYVHTDRSVYRPEHIVYFKGTARQPNGLTPIAGEAVEVRINDSEGTEIFRDSFESDDFGSFHGEVQLGVEPPLGSYSIITAVAGEEVYNNFYVEEFQKPEYKVDVISDDSISVQGGKATFVVKAEYLFGGVVAGGKVNYSILEQPHYRWRYKSRYGFYEDSNYSSYYGGNIIDRGEGVLDENGELVVEVDLPARDEDYELSLQAGVMDEARREIQGSGSLVAYRSEVVLNVTTDSYASKVGESITVNVQAESIYGGPVSVPFTLDAKRYYWSRGEGRLNDGTESFSGRTDEDGEATLEITLERQGSYQLEATAQDSLLRESSAERYMWVSDNSRWYWAYDSLKITTDKPEYSVGDTARFVIESPVTDAWALISLEGQELGDYEVVKLDGSVLTYELPLTADMVPNGYLSVTIVGEGEVYTQTTGFRVPPEDKFLNVEITSNSDSYKPGEVGTFAVRVSDTDGKGVKTQVVLGLVDEGIYLVRPDSTEDIRGFFYALKPNVVGTQLSRWFYFGNAEVRAEAGSLMMADAAPTSSKLAARAPLDDAIFAQGKGEADFATAEVREDFRDTILWLPTLETDEDGLLTTEVTFPDNLTEWRMTARVISQEDQVGQNTYNVISTLPVIARLAAPRFFIKGDEASLRVIGQNNLDEDQAGQLEMTAEGLSIGNPDPQTTTLPAGNRATADFKITATDTGISSVTATALTPEASDAMKLPIPVLPHGIREEKAWAGSGSDSWTFTLPEAVDPNSLGGSLYLTPSLAAAVSPALSYLAGYPYGCTEQTMSRFLPSVLAAQAGDLAKLPADIEENLDDIVQKGLKRLYDFQHDDGGWGFWKHDESSLFITSYVLNGLLDAQQAGYSVKEYVLEWGFDYLSNQVTLPSEETSFRGKADNDGRAYGYYALARANRSIDGIYSLAEADGIAGMSPYGLALSALAFMELDRSTEAKLFADELKNRVTERDQVAYWESGAERYRWNDDRIEATAFALEALVRLNPEDVMIPKVVNWLLLERQGARWVSTKDTAAVIKASLKLAEVSDESNYDYQIAVTMNGETLASERVQGQQNESIDIDLSNIVTGQNELSLDITGEGKLYASANVHFVAERDFIETESEHMVVQRRYEVLKAVFNEQEERIVYEKSRLRGDVAVGDYVLVTIKIDPKESDYRYVMVNEPLAAGFRVVENDQGFRIAGVESRYGRDYYGWNYWYDGRDVRDERVDYYFSYLGNPVSFTYLLHAETPGDFTALPTQAWLMYEPDVRGIGSERSLGIVEELINPSEQASIPQFNN